MSQVYRGPAERSLGDFLSLGEAAVVSWLVRRVLNEVPAELVEAALFGSVARGEATAESDLDVLLIFRELPPDREPQASQAESIAGEVAAESGVPVTVWSVSLLDLREGNRTPMLVDALRDSVPVWVTSSPVPVLPFTPPDALRCVAALLTRVEEGSVEFREALAEDKWEAAARRGRDDIVRLCTAWLLLHGITRPRRAAAVRDFWSAAFPDGTPSTVMAEVLDWAIRSFGSGGRDDDLPVELPPDGPRAVAAAIDSLHAFVEEIADRVYHRWYGGDGRVDGAPVLHPSTPEMPSRSRLRSQ